MLNLSPERGAAMITLVVSGVPQWLEIPKGTSQAEVNVARDTILKTALRLTARPVEILTLFKNGLPYFCVRLYQ